LQTVAGEDTAAVAVWVDVDEDGRPRR